MRLIVIVDHAEEPQSIRAPLHEENFRHKPEYLIIPVEEQCCQSNHAAAGRIKRATRHLAFTCSPFLQRATAINRIASK